MIASHTYAKALFLDSLPHAPSFSIHTPLPYPPLPTSRQVPGMTTPAPGGVHPTCCWRPHVHCLDMDNLGAGMMTHAALALHSTLPLVISSSGLAVARGSERPFDSPQVIAEIGDERARQFTAVKRQTHSFGRILSALERIDTSRCGEPSSAERCSSAASIDIILCADPEVYRSASDYFAARWAPSGGSSPERRRSVRLVVFPAETDTLRVHQLLLSFIRLWCEDAMTDVLPREAFDAAVSASVPSATTRTWMDYRHDALGAAFDATCHRFCQTRQVEMVAERVTVPAPLVVEGQ